MKTTSLLLTILLVPLDYIMLIAASVVAYFLRFESFVTDLKPAIYEMPFAEYLQVSIIMAFAWIVIFAINGMYREVSKQKIITELWKIFAGCSIGLILIVFMIFLQRELFSSRFIILTAYGLAILFLIASRMIYRVMRAYLYSKDIGLNHALLIGTGKSTEIIKKEIDGNGFYGVSISKHIDTFDADKIEDILKKRNIDEMILVNDSATHQDELSKAIDLANSYNVSFRYAADVLGAKVANIQISTIAGIPMFELQKTALNEWGRVYKRLFDIITSILLIIVTSPILAILVLIIRLTSKGPAIYKNQRVGRKGNIFDTYKLRTMKIEYCTGPYYEHSKEALEYEQKLIMEKSHRKGPLYKISKDPRRTEIGKWLEKTSLDELPQFFNVLLGNMSLVGPRPHQPREVDQYKSYHKKLLEIKPGVTGLAQISGRSDLDFEEEVKLDIFYMENWSPFLDLSILIKTPFTLFKKRKFS